MPTRDQILRDIREYSAQEVAQAILDGEITFEELNQRVTLTPLMRLRVERFVASATPAMPTPPEFTAEQPAMPPMQPEQPQYAPMPPTYPTPTPTYEPREKKGMFKNPFSFEGRIRRLEYGISYIIYFIWCALVSLGVTYAVIHMFVKYRDINAMIIGIGIASALTFIPLMWFMLAQGAKRCHDVGHSGWFQIIPFYWLWMLFAEGSQYDNEYGTNPK